jgi:hypothetical protein
LLNRAKASSAFESGNLSVMMSASRYCQNSAYDA